MLSALESALKIPKMPKVFQNNRINRTSFGGILRTSQGSTILVDVKIMPISPESPTGFPADRAYGHPAESQERGADVGQSIYMGQQYDGQTGLVYDHARYYCGSQGQYRAPVRRVRLVGRACIEPAIKE